jgi:hypothetical protein
VLKPPVTRGLNLQQEKLLFYLSEEVTRTPAVFEQAELTWLWLWVIHGYGFG